MRGLANKKEKERKKCLVVPGLAGRAAGPRSLGDQQTPLPRAVDQAIC